ncbi:hypothetical protein PVAP13_1KG278005 [Panicum virgatum]|uniref:Uncharacterized protein n=1 Tax=Panicum virgatum TaxID=38727 RepID=A0A8T0X924_PANVG|nr:hypothetical protein PVAP13_1KG278005 [Panicum virgatum]
MPPFPAERRHLPRAHHLLLLLHSIRPLLRSRHDHGKQISLPCSPAARGDRGGMCPRPSRRRWRCTRRRLGEAERLRYGGEGSRVREVARPTPPPSLEPPCAGGRRGCGRGRTGHA